MKTSFKVSSFFLFFMLISSTAFAGNLIIASKKELLKVHNALMETVFPYDEGSVPQRYKDELNKESPVIFKEIIESKEAIQVLKAFANLKQFENPLFIKVIYQMFTGENPKSIKSEDFSEIKKFIQDNSRPQFGLALYELPVMKRRELLSIMLQSKVNFHRRMAYIAKTLYITKIYRGKLAEEMSGLVHREDTNEVIPPAPKFKAKISFDAKKKIIKEKFDYIVVGSGVAGSVVVNQLQKAGKKVLLLEKGPFIIPGGVNARDNFKFMEHGGLRGSFDGGMYFLNGAVSGGGSSVNIDMSYPPTLPYIAINFERWRSEGKVPNEIWSPKQISEAYTWVRDMFEPRIVGPDELNENNRILMNGADQLGLHWEWFELLTLKNKEDRPGYISDKKSVVEVLLEEGFEANQNPVAFLPNSKVLKVLHQKVKDIDSAYGVQFEVQQGWGAKGMMDDPMNLKMPAGSKVEVYADHVILSAGTLGTTMVLLQSEIKNDYIGRGVVSHPFAPILGHFDHEVNAHLGTASAVYVDHFLTTDAKDKKEGFLIEGAGGNPALVGVMVPGSPMQVYDNVKRSKKAAGMGVILVEDTNLDNRIMLGKNGEPFIKYALSDKDKRRFGKGMATAMRILFKAGAKKVSMNNYQNFFSDQQGMEYQYFTDISQADLVEKNFAAIPNQALMMGAHMLGANKLGTDPKKSVVNSNHESWEVKKLYVVDASVFPESVGANPMQTIYTMAKMFVDRHLQGNK